MAVAKAKAWDALKKAKFKASYLYLEEKKFTVYFLADSDALLLLKNGRNSGKASSASAVVILNASIRKDGELLFEKNVKMAAKDGKEPEEPEFSVISDLPAYVTDALEEMAESEYRETRKAYEVKSCQMK